MTTPTAIDALAVIAIVAWRVAIATGPRKSTVDDSRPPPADPSVDRAVSTIGWAQGSRADWDRHVRPVLARALGTGVGERTFGTELWPLVDPSRPFTADLDRPGPGRDGLARILDQLEHL